MTLPDLCAFLALFARIAAWSFAAPLIGDKVVAPRLRIAVAVLLSAALAFQRPKLPFDQMVLVLPGELIIGLMAGFCARMVLAGAEAAGQLVGLSLELGFAASFDPLARDEALPTRRLALALGGLAFLGAGGLELSVSALALAPLSTPGLGPTALVMPLCEAGAQVSAVAMVAAAPVVLAALVANLAMAVASRAAPALNVFSVMLAGVLVVGAFTLRASAPGFAVQLFSVARHAAESATYLLSHRY